MERYFKLFIVALFATMSFALTGCGDDDDEPNDPNDPNDPNNGDNTSSEIAFNLNGKDYYWVGDLWDMGSYYNPSSSWGSLSVTNEQYVIAIATAYSRKLKDSDDFYNSNDFNQASIVFQFKDFNWQTAKKGQELEFDIVHRNSDDMWWGCEIGLMTPYSNIEQSYAWYGSNGVKGSAKFVSYKDNTVWIEFSNVIMTNDDFHKYEEVDDNNIPTTLTLNGTVPFVIED